MLTGIKGQTKSFLKSFPFVKRYLQKKNLRKKFKTELELIKGTHHNENTHKSIIHFSVNKAATQYVKSILQRCAAEIGMVNVNIHDYAFQTDFPFLDHLSADEMQKYQHIFKPTGYLYSVFGGMIENIPDLEKYLLVLMVRDPRDVLVSSYYSIAHSHTEPYKTSNKYNNFMEKRDYAQKVNIDEYVTKECSRAHSVYHRYQKLLLNNYPHIHVTQYENMISDFNGWLKALIGYCEFELSNHFLESLDEENKRLKPNREDIHKHLRKGIAGDYKEKLKSETIDYLNTEFSSILKRLGYT